MLKIRNDIFMQSKLTPEFKSSLIDLGIEHHQTIGDDIEYILARIPLDSQQDADEDNNHLDIVINIAPSYKSISLLCGLRLMPAPALDICTSIECLEDLPMASQSIVNDSDVKEYINKDNGLKIRIDEAFSKLSRLLFKDQYLMTVL